MWEFLLEGHHYFTYIFEFLAAISGLIYLKKMPGAEFPVRFFTWYLCFIFVADLFGILYPTYGYFNDYKYIEFIKGTPFSGNDWWYNILHIIIFSVYILFFRMCLRLYKYRLILKYAVIFFIPASIINLLFFADFFNYFSSFVFILGTVLSLMSICFYYFELLYREEILSFSGKFEFFASAGILIYLLCINPGIIYYKFVRLDETFFDVYTWTIKLGNAYLYSMFSLGYYMDYRHGKKEAIVL